jgi:prepilin-type N-terminal cleavage/methylation domain-containing protein
VGMENRQSSLDRRALGRRARGEQGFSLIEVLIASGILLVVALGVLPIFAQAIVNNRGGADYTMATNIAKSELERLYSLPFSSPDLRVVGDETERSQYYSTYQKKWIDGDLVDGDTALWTRTTTIRQYGLGGVVDVDKDGELDPPLPGGTAETFVHVKEIEIQVVNGREGGPLGAGKRITLRTYKAY